MGDRPFDFAGEHAQLSGALCNPKPVQRPRPPFVISGRSGGHPARRRRARRRLDYPGADIDDALSRRALLDRYRRDLGRDPSEITASLVLGVAYDDPAATRTLIARALDAGSPAPRPLAPGALPGRGRAMGCRGTDIPGSA